MKKYHNYSLFSVSKRHDNGTIDGNWMQNLTARTLDEMQEIAEATRKANSRRINMAIVDYFVVGGPDYGYKIGLKEVL